VRAIGWALLLSGMASAQAASFNCANAKTPQESAICSSPELSASDDRMAAAYKSVLGAAPQDMRPGIVEGQRAWIREMGAKCKSQAPTLELVGCLMTLEATRTENLQHMVRQQGGITFVWKTVETTTPDDAETQQLDRQRGSGANYATLHESWPQANSKAAEWQAWNKAVEAATIAMNDGPAVDMDVDLNTSIGYVGKQVVTAVVDDQSYGHGAAHPSENSLQLSWMLREQRWLRPEDVFRAGSGWSALLYARCDQYLHGQLDEPGGETYDKFDPPGQMEKTLHGIVDDPENWQIDQHGITIVFQQYAVACYVCTPPPLTIPWSDLKPLLNPSFALPQ
jgi:uncharacterized protein YecT (DUF1311 family)